MEIINIWEQLEFLAKMCRAVSDAHKMDQFTIETLTRENRRLKEALAKNDPPEPAQK